MMALSSTADLDAEGCHVRSDFTMNSDDAPITVDGHGR